MSRRSYRNKKQNRFGMFMVSLVVVMMMLVVSVKCVELKNKLDESTVRKEELQAQLAEEEARTEELKELKKYIQTDSYVEKVAQEKLGLVHSDEILFKIKR